MAHRATTPSRIGTITPHSPSPSSRTAAITRPLKRKRQHPSPTLRRAIHVLSTEATALSFATRLYETDAGAQDALLRALDYITATHEAGGKLVVCGVGKSGLVGRKLEASLKSLGIGASFLHAAEAVHGDLGDLRANDAVLFITYSGRTTELLNVITHIPATNPVMVLSGHMDVAKCPLAAGRPNCVLLPAPIHESEEQSFGVKAPTTSTTVAMAVGDMLAITVAERVHENRVRRIFEKNHPGGAIGADARQEEDDEEEDADEFHMPLSESRFAVPLEDIPTVKPSGAVISALDIHFAAANSPRGWVWIEHGQRIMRPRDVKKLRKDTQIDALSHDFAATPSFDAYLTPERLINELGVDSPTYYKDMFWQETPSSRGIVRLRGGNFENSTTTAVVDFEDIADEHLPCLPDDG